MNYAYLFIVVVLLSACSQKGQVAHETFNKHEHIQDLVEIPQDPGYYASKLESNSYISDIDTFVKNYFRVWNIDKISIDRTKATWAYVYDNNKSYTYTLQPIKEDFFDAIKENSNFEAFSSINKKGVSLKLLNVRALPTDKPIFLDPSQAGEGYPFDYLQNTSLAPNKPILISHYSKDKKWAFIECSFGFGWVKARDIVMIESKYTTLWQKAEQIFFMKDNQPIYDQNNNYLFDSRIGMVLPLIDEDQETYTVLTISKTQNDTPLFLRSKISKSIVHKGILHFNTQNITKLMQELKEGKYGWGGIYGQRDCSSTLRDFYTPFGFWLPRNSSVQSAVGTVFDLKELSNEEKIALIKQYGKPFKTLVYKRGHIALYVGLYNGEVIIFQNVWGVKTKKDGAQGRFLIAKPVFSTLEVGKNLTDFDPSASMLSKVQSINQIVE